MSKTRILCPICNEVHPRIVEYKSVEAFITHMTREHNWSTNQAVQYYEEYTV